MLRDRLALVEAEIEKMNNKCSSLYREIAILGDRNKLVEYNDSTNKLSSLMEQMVTIKELISQGKS